ncbi:hypothetical protein AMS66_23180 [Paenibacillus xylanivorans]|uniref:Uncharacterized protein n=1 Tax=Paenibacillus xylanivorans TaxID=1705561 RepID=A0A0M9BKF0_9BACL|nr:hypothetical protein AMS66_23180 [Paenibacillus xylanivorans]
MACVTRTLKIQQKLLLQKAHQHTSLMIMISQKRGGTLTTSAIAQYEIRIFNNPISGMPLIFAANTGKASVDYNVSYY